MSRQPPEDINDKNMMNMDNDHGIYCTGLCGEFAVALSENVLDTSLVLLFK
jgi:hypothetical protein